MCAHAFLGIALYEIICVQRRTVDLLTQMPGGEKAWIYVGNMDVNGKTKGRNQTEKEKGGKTEEAT